MPIKKTENFIPAIMNENELSMEYENGVLDGIYLNAGIDSPLVIIINGHNGFYNYGMFPYLQQELAKQHISSYSFNFSHGGVKGDTDYFGDLEKYEKNCMRLELADVMCVLHNLDSGKIGKHIGLFLLAHSLGGVPLIFAAKKAQDENIPINGLILLSSVERLDFWPDEMVSEWKKNNRTKQMLPQGEEFLHEVLQSNSTWNVEHEIKKLKPPVLFIHGENDEAVPKEHSKSLFNYMHPENKNSFLTVVPGATHTYNTRHPFEGTTPQLEEMIKAVVGFIETYRDK